MESMVDSLNHFSFDLFKSVNSNVPENTIISTLSVFIAMLMALAGSKNDTQDQFLKTLNLKNTHSSLNYEESIKNLLKLLIADNSEDKENQVLIANKLIINNIAIEDSYKNLIEKMYDSKIDFINSTESLKIVIEETNKWISDLTNNKISNILDDSFKSVALSLINAVYFKYEWLHEFDGKKTKKRDFYITKEKSIKLDLMELNNKQLLYYYSDKLNSHILSLPYKKEKFYFNILLPTNENDFLLANDKNSLINKLDYSLIKSEIQSQVHEAVSLTIPKFVVKKKLKLNEFLQSMGIQKAFDSNSANFSGISQSSKLYIHEVLHYSYIEINEKGTEAAGATVVNMVKRSLAPIIHINLERPFVYFISEKTTGSVLFCGKFMGESMQDLKKEKTEL